MKSLVCVVAVVFLYSCSAEREVQVEMMNAELIKIDTIYRYPGVQQVLTWRCAKDMEYISFEPINNYYKLGFKTPVLVRR